MNAKPADSEPPILWDGPKRLRARLTAHSEVVGWPESELITVAVKRFLDDEAPHNDTAR